MVDFKNISPDKAQAIVSALKDGSISSKEMKDLGLTEQEAAELNRAFSSGEARIGDFVLVNKNKSENENSQNSASLEAKGKQSNEESDWWDKTCDFVKEHAGGLAAGGLFIGGGILSATGFASGLGVPMMLAGAAIGLSSCSPDTEILQNVAVTITESSTLRDTLAALKEGQDVSISILKQILDREIKNGMTQEEILKLVGNNQQTLELILDALTTNNQLMNDIQNSIDTGNQDILKALVEIKQSVQDINNFVTVLPNDIKSLFQGDLDAIMNAINQGNVSLANILQNVDTLAAKLESVIDNIETNGKTQEEIKEILRQIRSGQLDDAEKLLAMLDILGDIKNISVEINDKLDVIIGKFEDTFADNAEIKDSLARIEAALDSNNAKSDVTNDLLMQLLNKYNSGDGYNFSEADLQKILDSLANLLESQNNMNNKLDILNATGNAILAKLENQFGKQDAAYTNITNLLEAIKNKESSGSVGGNYDDTALLEKLDKVLAKLDEIAAAIRDHNVTVDVTGKVTCECNCGSNHEGIIGDLEDILG